jgi:hypothetical protein
MTKIDDLILALQREIRSHSWSTFQVEVEPGGAKMTVPGCPLCQEQLATNSQFIEHLADAIPALFARLRTKAPLA